jgi:putative glutamine amidotransferase
MRPKIVVTLDEGQTLRRGVPFPTVEMKAAYARSIIRAGGIPLMVAPTDEVEVIAGIVELLDGLVITGGAFDISPEIYGKSAGDLRVDAPKPLRTSFELALFRGALARSRPIFGVCGGMQLMNVALGGTLLLDIKSEIEDALEHEQPTSPATPAHSAEVLRATSLAELVGARAIEVNTTHHQAIDRVADPLVVSALSADGVIEAVDHRQRPEVFGVQWHPELLDDEVSRALYAFLVNRSRL